MLNKIKVAGKKKATHSLPGIQGVADLQGKCAILRDAFFPANVDIPDPLPPGFLPESLGDISDTHRTIEANEVNCYLRPARKYSAYRADGTTYEILTQIANVRQSLLATLLDALLRYGVFPPAWKHVICVPIPKPGRTDLTNPAKIRPISLLSCLGKTFEKILAKRVATGGTTLGAIT